MFKRRKRRAPAPVGQGVELRALALRADREALGLEPSSGTAVWGVIMDTVMPDGAWHCLVAFADGTTSLYTSAAFGVIGAGEHPSVRRANDGLLRAADAALALFTPSASTDLPVAGHVAIRALTVDGPRVLTAPEIALGSGQHAASAVFHAAHEVVTQVRVAAPG